MVILENIDIDIDKAILQNIDIDKILNRFKFGISNRATEVSHADDEAAIETLRNEKPDTSSPMAPSPEKEVIREELSDEDLGDGFCKFVEVPHDFGTPDYDHDPEKTDKATEILGQTDRCCFCNYRCPAPSELENGGRLFGVLENLWDHIEAHHPRAYEWLG